MWDLDNPLCYAYEYIFPFFAHLASNLFVPVLVINIPQRVERNDTFVLIWQNHMIWF
jgi:hypothetical protein